MQRQLEDPEARVVSDLAVGDRGGEGVVACPAGADDEFADPLRVGDTAWVLGRKPLVFMVMSNEHEVRPSRVEVLPERIERGVTPMLSARGEARLVPVGEGALPRMRGEIALEPALLGRAGGVTDLPVE